MFPDDSTPNYNADWSLPRPTWHDWSRTSRCKLWEAVVLACNVDPACFQPYGLAAGAAQDGALTPIPSSIQTLLGLAKIAVASGNLKPTQTKSADLMQSDVELSDFTAWLQALGHAPPIEYPWTTPDLVVGNYQWPWGSYQTKELQLLAMAADKFWKNYDSSDRSTAPKNEAVIAWLEERKISKRKAEVMASLLRADDLPTGPR